MVQPPMNFGEEKLLDAFKSELKRQTSSLRMSFNTLSSDLKASGSFASQKFIGGWYTTPLSDLSFQC